VDWTEVVAKTWMPLMYFIPPTMIAATIYTMFTPWLWPFALVYLFFFLATYNLPWRGAFPIAFVRKHVLFRLCGEYFSLKLVKTYDFEVEDPERRENYMFVCHPHGCLGLTGILTFGAFTSGFDKLFKGYDARMVTLPINFYIPVTRETLMALGAIPSDVSSIEYHLTRRKGGQILGLYPGGAEESLDAHPDNYDLTLKERKGFIKVAIRTGANLVPVYNFGENKMYHQVPNPRGSLLRCVQSKIKKVFRVATPLFSGRGFLNDYFGLLPMRVPITTVVGAPIRIKQQMDDPSDEEIDELHQQYVEALVDLFETHKADYGVGKDVHLGIY